MHNFVNHALKMYLSFEGEVPRNGDFIDLCVQPEDENRPWGKIEEWTVDHVAWSLNYKTYRMSAYVHVVPRVKK